MKTINRPLAPLFNFAGFNFPKYAWRIPTRSLMSLRSDEIKTRLERGRNPITGEYQIPGLPRVAGEDAFFFYLDSDFMPRLRWEWCDEVKNVRIDHTGWFTDDYRDQEIRGLVFTLPRGRGFLAGWSMGEGMAGHGSTCIYASAVEAAHAADSMAEDAAEKERGYQEEETARIEAEEEEARLATMEEEKAWEAECAMA